MIDLLIENSLKENATLIESDEVDGDFYRQMLGGIFRDKIKSFIGHHIAEVQPLNQPSGIIFAREETFEGEGTTDAGTFKIIKKLVNVDTNKTIVKISPEAWEDILALNKTSTEGESKFSPEIFIKWVKSTTGHKETLKLLNLLKESATESDALSLSNAETKQNAETNLFYISKKVSDLVIKINEKSFRTYDSFCILPQKNVGGILSLSFPYSRFDDSSDENRAVDYFIGKINHTRYYLNPSPEETSAIVGLKTDYDSGVSSIIYSPYNMNITTALDYQSGLKTVAIFSRNAYTINPLHSEKSPMIYKFEINS